MGLATYALACFLLFQAVPRAPGDPPRFFFLVVGALSFLVLNLLRDRLFPAEEKLARPALGRAALARSGAYLRTPSTGVYICLGFVFLPMLSVQGFGSVPDTPILEIIAQIYPFWAALVSASALLWIRVPDSKADRVFSWWIPCALILLIGIAGVQLLPDLLFLVTTGREANSNATTLPMLLPIASLGWRIYRYGKESPV